VAVAVKRLGHLFPQLTKRSGFYMRRDRLADVIKALIDEFARHSPGYYDELLVVELHPGRMRPLARDRQARRAIQPRRSAQQRHRLRLTAPATAATSTASGCTACSRSTAPARALALLAEDRRARGRAEDARPLRPRREILIGDSGYARRTFEDALATLGATIHRPRRKDEPAGGPHLAPIRQRIESIYWTCCISGQGGRMLCQSPQRCGGSRLGVPDRTAADRLQAIGGSLLDGLSIDPRPRWSRESVSGDRALTG
jgi:hypothetical protein